MDYSLVHAVNHRIDHQQRVVNFYDINCQYSKNLYRRIEGNGFVSLTASISSCFMTKHCKKIEERDTLLFTILFDKKDKYHKASLCHFLCQDML